ncbi:hypothetical protein [Lacunisphaera limnophila]|uniref:hypothetical protein n=1 Tax=Lacunisphaera limnophila TaxID=1838286 RepID=UPI0008597352|nr:hypothetical protein [Lacunisphaera limnophila]
MNLIAFFFRRLWSSGILDLVVPVVVGFIFGAASMYPVWQRAELLRVAAQPKPYEMPLSAAVRTWWLHVSDSKPPGAIESVFVFARGVDVMRSPAPDSEAFTMHVIDEVLIRSGTADSREEPQSVTIKCHELKDTSKVKLFRFRRIEKGVASFSELAADGSESQPITLSDASMAFD